MSMVVDLSMGKGCNKENNEEDKGAIASSNSYAIVHGQKLEVPDGSPKTFTEVIRRATDDYPEREIVFVEADGTETIQTYARLKGRAEKMLAELRSHNLHPGDIVILFVADEDFIAAFWGCLIGGFVPVPMMPNLKRKEETQAKLQHAWTTLHQPLIVSSESLAEAADMQQILSGENPLRLATVDSSQTREPARDWHESKPEDLAYIVMSSGTTGIPKMVQMSHRVVTTRFIRGYARKLSATGKNILLNWMPFSHSAGLQVVRPQWDRVIYMQTDVVLQEPLRWLDAIDRYGVTNITLPNFALGAITDRVTEYQSQSPATDAEKHKTWNLSTLRRIGVSTEAIVPRTARLFLELLRPYELSTQSLHPNYSMSEVGAITTSNHWSPLEVDKSDRFVEVGAPDQGCSIRIVDEREQIVQQGETGRIQAYSPVMTPGYHQDPERTAGAFTADGWFKTGDLGFLKDGQLTVTGRHKELIIINGHNYHSAEIESVVEGIAGLEKGYTAACATRKAGSNTDELVLFFHALGDKKDELSLLLKQIRRTLNQEMGVNPAYLLPVEKEMIPRTVSGKIQRLKLKKRFEAGKFDSVIEQVAGIVETAQQSTFVAPSTDTEKTLANIWQALLKLDRVGIEDNFFELGGHSLLATQVVSRIRKATQLDLPLHTLFANPTISQLATVIDKTLATDSAPPLSKRAHVQQTIPLSFSQQRLWFAQQLEPESRAYHLTKALRLQGKLSFDALQKSLTAIVERHEALRTRFVQQRRMDVNADNLPVQVVDPPKPVELPLIDLTDCSERPVAEREDVLQSVLSAETRRLFDLATDLMVRATLVRLKCDEHVLLVVMHHIASDGWSMGIFKRELSVLYRAFASGHTFGQMSAQVSGQQSPLPALSVQYADFALWQRDWLTGQALEAQLNYWKQQLSGAPPLLAFPTDRPYPLQPSHKGDSVTFTLSAALSDRLKSLSRQNGATLYMTLLAAFNTLLYRYSYQEDIVVGSPIASRDRPELEDLIGFFVNTLTLRTDLAGEPTFQTLLQRVRETTLGAYAHQNIPFEELVTTLKPARTPGHSPWFQVMFVFQNQPLREIALPGLTISPFQRKRKQGNVMFDITLFMKEGAEGLSGKLVYKTALFEPETIRRMAGHLETLLAAVVDNPQQSIAKLPLLTQRERQQLLDAATASSASSPDSAERDNQRCIHQLFEAQAMRSPDAIALTHKNQQLTYKALNDRANYLANYLRSLGVAPDSLVGLCVERSIDMVVGLLGILKAGGAYVPLDPTYPADRLAMMVEDAQPQVVVTLQTVRNALPALDVPVVCLDSQWHEIVQSSGATQSSVGSNNLAYVIYTSGSTGKPKGVMIEHRSLVNFTQGAIAQYGINQRDRVLQFASINFDAAAEEIFPALCTGATLVIRTDEMLASPATFITQCQALNLSVLDLPTAYWHRLTAALPGTACPVPSSLRLVIIGGEAALPDQLQNWQTWCSKHQHKGSSIPQIINTYGPTESTVVAAAYPIASSAKLAEIPIGQGYGKGFAGAQIYLLDAYLQPVPAGVVGEIYIGGCGLARGYLNRAELTHERFVPNPYSAAPNARLYKTGDLARYLPDGSLKFLGRRDAQIKIRGFRIELGEIESALGEHVKVRQCTVIDQEETPGDKRLVAYVVLADVATANDTLPVRELRQWLQQKLPSYMVPSAWVSLPELPLTKNGKIDRRALPVPDVSAVPSDADYAAPRTSTEQQIAEIWAEVLTVDRVGIYDDFFELGGHSLLAIQVAARLSQCLNKEISLNLLFTAFTLEEFAKRCETVEAERMPLVRAERTQPVPLSFAQQRIWFLQQLEPENSTYKIARSLRLRGFLNKDALQRALTTIASRHEALRTRFVSNDGLPTQVVAPPAEVSLPLVDLSSAVDGSHDQKESRLAALLKQEGRRPFNLATDLMLRATLFRLKEDEHVLQIVIHHIAADGWSIGVFRRELSALYTAYAAGDVSPLSAPPLSALPVQYIDFSEWQRQWLSGDVLNTQLTYWKNQLKGVPPLLELPTDYPRPLQPSHKGAKLTFMLSKPVIDSIKGLAQQSNATLYMTLLSAFKALLFRYTQQSDVVVGSPIANRPYPELEGLIGLFLNTLVLRTELSDELTFQQLLDRVKKVSLGAYAHQDLPFEQLLETLKPERDLSYSPWFQVMFILQRAGQSAPEMLGLETTTERGEGTTAKFDLTLTMREQPEGLCGTLEYSLDLFKPETIERMVEHFQTLLAGVVANSGLPIAQLPLLGEAERKLLLSSRRQTVVPAKTSLCIHELFEKQVERTPDAIALQHKAQHAHQQLTYRALNHRANRLAHHLRQLGVTSEVLVGLCVDRSVEMIVGLLGILKAGGAYVPLDPNYPKERLKMMVDDANPQVIVTLSAVQASLPRTDVATVCLDSDWDSISSSSVADITDSQSPAAYSSQSNLAYVIYTSGSTGKPKGVMVEHGALVNFVTSAIAEYQIVESDRVLQFASINFDAAIEEIFPTLCTGATLVLRTDDMISSAQHFMQQCQALALTVLDLPTAYWHQLGAELPKTSCTLPPSLRLVIIGGEAPIPDLLGSWQSWAQSTAQPGATLPTIVNTYGPTEATVVATCHRVEAIAPATTDIPIGHSLPHTQTYVLNSQLQPSPIGVPGDLYIGGSGLARGYLHRESLTQERFIAHPFSNNSAARLYKTGDVACYQPDGTLRFLGRRDQQVKVRGFRIELGEVETVLCQHPDVQQCSVVAREDTPGDGRLVAYIVASNAARSPDSRQLQQFLQQNLPSYMVPSAFVPLSELPLTPSKKVDRRALPKPSTADIRGDDSFVAPRNLLETQIADIWAEILSLEQVSIHDNFFELGGHSLLAAQVIARIQTVCEITLPLAALFETPTIAGIAQQNAVAAAEKVGKNSPLVLLKQGNPRQTPLFLIHDADGDVSLYGNLAANLRGDRTIYALKPRSAPGVPMVSSRIETICADFREQIQTVQPRGPYLLGGLCVGGRLAFEIALQLEEEGEKVALVAMMDSVGKGTKKRAVYAGSAGKRGERKKKVSETLSQMAKGPAGMVSVTATLAKKVKNRLAYEAERRLSRWQVRTFRRVYEGQTQPLPVFMKGLSVRKLLVFAVKDYFPRAKFNGQTLLIKASYGMTETEPAYADVYEDPQFGWGSCVTQPLQVHQVAGGHNTMLSADKIEELEGVLAAAIDRSLQTALAHSSVPVSDRVYY